VKSRCCSNRIQKQDMVTAIIRQQKIQTGFPCLKACTRIFFSFLASFLWAFLVWRRVMYVENMTITQFNSNEQASMDANDKQLRCPYLCNTTNQKTTFHIFHTLIYLQFWLSKQKKSYLTSLFAQNLFKCAWNRLTLLTSTTWLGKLFQMLTIRAEK